MDSDSDHDRICNICLDDMAHPTLTNCNHQFCEACLCRWLQTQQRFSAATCPMCRRIISTGTHRLSRLWERAQERLPLVFALALAFTQTCFFLADLIGHTHLRERLPLFFAVALASTLTCFLSTDLIRLTARQLRERLPLVFAVTVATTHTCFLIFSHDWRTCFN